MEKGQRVYCKINGSVVEEQLPSAVSLVLVMTSL